MKWSLLKALVFVTAAFSSLLIQETLARNSLEKVLIWLQFYPHQAFGNLLIILCLMSLFVAIMGRVVPGLMGSVGLIVGVSIVNQMKIGHLQQPLYPWDLAYFEQIFVLLPTMSPSALSSSLFFPLSAGFFVLFFVFFRRERAIRINFRMLVVSLSTMILAGFIYHRQLPVDLPAWFKTENAVWDQRANYQKNGFLLAMAFNVQPLFIERPADYSEAAVRELLHGLGPTSLQKASPAAKKSANLILFLSESFYDLKHVPYETEKNPLENLEGLRKRFPHFRMISPVFGGGTSNAEFEVLTGLSNAFLPEGAVPFDHYLTDPLPSVASVLRDSGYRTIALHPYHEWYWNRNNAYPLLGFDEFYFLKDFKNAYKRGWFVSDEALVDEIISTVEAVEGPYFIHALSMQNHGVYDPHRYGSEELPVKGDYPEKLRLALQTFVTGVRDADAQLGRLVKYLEKRKEPTLVLFCGDHLPSFGDDFALYRQAGAVVSEPRELTLEEHFEMSSVPCLLWSNKKEILKGLKLPKNLSPNYIPPLLLGQLGVEMPDHLRYLSRGMREYPVIHPRFLWTRSEGLMDFRSGRDLPFLQGLGLLHYDVLFGERNALEAPRHVSQDVAADVAES